jgi:hypothetical protein
VLPTALLTFTKNRLAACDVLVCPSVDMGDIPSALAAVDDVHVAVYGVDVVVAAPTVAVVYRLRIDVLQGYV